MAFSSWKISSRARAAMMLATLLFEWLSRISADKVKYLGTYSLQRAAK